jgi:hypothetical protein
VAHRVLLSVEDSDADYYLIKMAVRETGMAVEICRTSDGEQARFFVQIKWIRGFAATRPDPFGLESAQRQTWSAMNATL